NHTIKELVKIQDIFPSLLDLSLGRFVDTDGKSVKQLLFGNYEGWRQEIHGEHSLGVNSSQYILTKQWKFIWFPVKNTYQLFNMI
ncbi:arylsulfatase, partial [Enterococcus faecalis]